MWYNVKQFISTITPVLLVLLFTYTGIAKLLEQDQFYTQLRQLQIKNSFAKTIAISLPVSELLVALLISIPTTRFYALWAALLLMIAFTSYIIVVLTGTNIPCACGGITALMSWPQHLYFNGFFIIIILFTIYRYKFLHVYKEVS